MKKSSARPATLDDLKLVLKSLNEENADYFLIGGYSMFAHGFERTTSDIDILVPNGRENGEKIKKALLVLPDKSAEALDITWFDEKDTIRLADEFVVDIMFNAAGATYETLKKYADTTQLGDIPVKTINIEGLLLTKDTYREKDFPDRLELTKALREIKKDNKFGSDSLIKKARRFFKI